MTTQRQHERIADAEKRHGERTGDPIAGSKLIRAYCASCLEPIRVGKVRVWNYCVDCTRPCGRWK